MTTHARTTPGSYLVEVRAAAGALPRSVRFRLEVAGFAVTMTPATATVTRGTSTSLNVNVQGVADVNQPVLLATTGALPAGVTVTFAPATISGGGTSMLTIATSAATPIGTHRLAFTAASGGIALPVTVVLTVNAPR